MYRCILVPVNTDPSCERAVARAYQLTRLLGGSVTLLFILDDSHEAARAEAAARVEVLSTGARLPPTALFVPRAGRDDAQVIADVARERLPDLILLSAGAQDESLALAEHAAVLATTADVPVKLVPVLSDGARRGSRWLEDATRHANSPGTAGVRHARSARSRRSTRAR